MSDEFRIEHDTMGEVRVPRRRPLAGADPARRRELPDLRQPPRARHIEALARIKGGRRRASTPSSASWTQDIADAIARRRRRGRRRRARRRLPDRRVPDRVGHVEQHERQRGLATLATRAARPRRPPERPRQRVAVVATTCSRRRSTSPRPQRVVRDLVPALDAPRGGARGARRAEFADVVKSGRTHLMDATPVTLGQEFGGYAAAAPVRHRAAASRRCPGSAELPARRHRGRHRHQHAGRLRRSASSSCSASDTGLPLTEARDHFEAQGAATALVELSGALRTIAVSLTKICNDLRWMGSGRAPASARSPPRPAAGLVDHARQGQPGDPRGRRSWSARRSSATTPPSRSPVRRATSSST